MSEVDDYLAALTRDQRAALQRLREQIRACVPEAEEVISYGMPGYRVRGKVVAGFAAFKRHLSYFPHSGSVLEELGDELSDFSRTKSALHFTVDNPLPPELVRRLVDVRLQQIR